MDWADFARKTDNVVNPYLVVSVVDPRDLPDDIMEMVENEVSNGRESIAEIEEKINKKVLERREVRLELQRGDRMLAVWQSVLISSKENGDAIMLEEAKSRIQGFKEMMTRRQNDLKKLNAEIQELEQQVIDEPEMRHMHKQLFQHD